MDFNLVQCIVEPENIGCSSNSSCSSDAAASSTESDGDAPVIVVSHSRSHLTITAKLSPYLNQKQWLNSAGIDQNAIQASPVGIPQSQTHDFVPFCSCTSSKT